MRVREMIALGIAFLGACNGPTAEFQRLQVRSDKIGYSAGPPPYSGYTLFGSLVLKDVPSGMEVSGQSTPRKLVGAHGTADFIPRFTRVRVVDGTLYFKAVVDEKSYWDVTGLLQHDSAIRVEFQGPEGRKWVARGTMEAIPAEHPAHPDLERALKD